MESFDSVVVAQMVKTGLLVLFFTIVLVYVFRKLFKVFKKGTGEQTDFIAVSRLISLGVTMLLLSTRVSNLFQSLFRIFSASFDYLLYLFTIGPSTSRGSVIAPSPDFTQFHFVDLILFFATWLFINTLLLIFLQTGSKPNAPKIFTDRLFAKNTFVVVLLIFSIYLCVASIVAIPEFQALENSEVNNDEQASFLKELNLANTSSKNDYVLTELPVADLKSQKSMEMYRLFNDRILGYNQTVTIVFDDYESRKNQAVDAYNSAILEKTALRERIRYRSQLKNWLQDRSGAFTFFTFYKPRFNTILRNVTTEVMRVEKDSVLRSNDAKVDSAYASLESYFDEWQNNEQTMQDVALNLKNIRYQVPEKPKIGEKYGVFKSMSGWLLNTESMSLALIVGLFAFGLLGSIGSMFIRERIRTGTDNGSSDFIPNLPAVLINGISSAIVVFLAVKGTLVIFSGKDAGVNPYVLFFTCLVAAVFSEDVWKWAQGKLHEQFKNNNNGGKAGVKGREEKP